MPAVLAQVMTGLALIVAALVRFNPLATDNDPALTVTGALNADAVAAVPELTVIASAPLMTSGPLKILIPDNAKMPELLKVAPMAPPGVTPNVLLPASATLAEGPTVKPPLKVLAAVDELRVNADWSFKVTAPVKLAMLAAVRVAALLSVVIPVTFNVELAPEKLAMPPLPIVNAPPIVFTPVPDITKLPPFTATAPPMVVAALLLKVSVPPFTVAPVKPVLVPDCVRPPIFWLRVPRVIVPVKVLLPAKVSNPVPVLMRLPPAPLMMPV